MDTFLPTNMWFFFTSTVTTSLQVGQYNEYSHPPFTFSIARCPRLTALSTLTSECAICPVTMFMSAPHYTTGRGGHSAVRQQFALQLDHTHTVPSRQLQLSTQANVSLVLYGLRPDRRCSCDGVSSVQGALRTGHI